MAKDKIQTGIDKQQALSDQISARDLEGSAHWQWYADKLAEIEQNYIKNLVSGSKEDHDRTAGIIEGLRIAYYLPHKVLSTKIT